MSDDLLWNRMYNEDENGNWYHGICSRNQEKKTDTHTVLKYIDTINGHEYTKYLHPETKEMGWRANIHGLDFTGVSLCHKKDPFVKKNGLIKALGRAYANMINGNFANKV